MKLNENSKNAIAGAAVVIAGGIAAFLFSRKKSGGLTTPQQQAEQNVAGAFPTFTPAAYSPVAPVINLGDSSNPYLGYNQPPRISQTVGCCNECSNANQGSTLAPSYSPNLIPPQQTPDIISAVLKIAPSIDVTPTYTYFPRGG